VAWSDLAGEAFIAFDRTTSIRQHLNQAFAESGTRPRNAIEARNISAVAGLVAAGLGVSAVPDCAAAGDCLAAGPGEMSERGGGAASWHRLFVVTGRLRIGPLQELADCDRTRVCFRS
jgi:DNA-binding transcriptional LysR family regulator